MRGNSAYDSLTVENHKLLPPPPPPPPDCIKMHPNTSFEASQYTMYLYPLSETIRIGAVVSLLFNSWNAFSHKSFYSNFTSFRVNLVIGAANREKSSMNLLQYAASSKKLRISKTDFGLSQLITASTFSYSTDTPEANTTCPKNLTSVSQNSHLLHLAYN